MTAEGRTCMNKDIGNANHTEMVTEFHGSYFNRVHRIGRITMLIALLLSFTPILYMQFVKGWSAPITDYLNVAFAIAALCLGFWLTEPFQWFPIIGAASLYMGYLAGNVKSIRVPVARQLRSKYGLDAQSPKGQIITTIGCAMSVYTNLIILTGIVILGNWLVSVLPPVVIEAFGYVIPSLIGALLAFRVVESGIVRTLKWSVPPILIYALMLSGKVPFLVDFGMTTSIGITILIGYIVYCLKIKKEDKEAK